MPSIFDLMPASLWPVQPFVPPPDPAQSAAWPSWASRWTPALPSPPLGWPTAAANVPADADSSVSEWDRAMRQALAAQSSAARDPGTGGTGVTDQMLADAKRAHDFVRWMFGPPSAPQAPPIGDAMLRGASQYFGGAPRNVVPASAPAPLSPMPVPAADNADAPPPAPADQQPDLGAAFGNPNIERQGARARAIAATRPPPDPAVTDFFSSIPRGVVRGLANTISASGNASEIEMAQPVDVPSGDEAADLIEQNVTGPLPKPRGPAGQFGETLGQFLGNPMSYLGPGGLGAKLIGTTAAALVSEAAGQLTKGSRAEPYARILGAMLGGTGAVSVMTRGPSAAEAAVNAARPPLAAPNGMPRAPLAPAPRALPAPPIEPSGAEIAGLPHVDPATVPLVPVDRPDWDSALAAARARGDIDLDALSARAHEVHGTLVQKAQGNRTTAVLRTDKSTIIGGGKRDLDPIQKPLRAGEIEARMAHADAERTVLFKALELGQWPRALATTRDICPDCDELITFMGGVISPDRRFAIFPP